MPPNAAIAGVGKQYDEIVVIVLLMALKSSGGAANPWYKDMSALDGTRSVSGFQHSLRAANKLAGELLEKKTKGEALVPEDVGRTSNGEGCGTVSPKKRKADANTDTDSVTASPKKLKTPRKNGRKKTVDLVNEEDGEVGAIKAGEEKGA